MPPSELKELIHKIISNAATQFQVPSFILGKYEFVFITVVTHDDEDRLIRVNYDHDFFYVLDSKFDKFIRFLRITKLQHQFETECERLWLMYA